MKRLFSSNTTAQSSLLFQGKKDKFRGLTIDDESVNHDREIFKQQIKENIIQWNQDGTRGVWLKLKENKAHLIDLALKEGGFKFHHAQDDYVMMTKWMPQDDNKLPGFSTHYVGVGGLVISKDKSKILAIQESKPLIKDLWKLPGGLVERGENLQTACIREVFEETGVQAKFVSILGFREVQNFKFGQSDIYFVLLLEAENEKIDIQMKDEISKAEWKDFKDLRHLKFTRMATNVCNILLKSKEAEEKKEGQSGLVNLKQVPLGDLFKTTAFTPEEYELFGTQNIFYSSEYMKLVGESIKNQNDSAKL